MKISSRLFTGFIFVAAGMFTGCGSMFDSSGPGDGGSGESGSRPGGGQAEPGVITAGQWNDLNEWDFWLDLLNENDYADVPEYWGFYTNNRVAVNVSTPDGHPVIDKQVTLLRGEEVLSRAKTDNRGNVQLWVGLNQKETDIDYRKLSLKVDIPGQDGASIDEGAVKPYRDGVNSVIVSATGDLNNIQVAFMVDATGSMGDELEFLKTDVVDVISRAGGANPGMSIMTAGVFYRDIGDDYVTRLSGFTDDVSVTAGFINQQKASGGGDFPEAVHTALEKSVGELQWSPNARARILFLLLDAPPHYNMDVIRSIHSSVASAMEKGITLIPITASGIDKETEFLMRMFAISTGGTYVFITDDSGVGNPHLKPSVGEYQVEYLNDLMVKLINEYSD